MEAIVQSENLMDSVIRCGLYLGAIFQLACIAAVVILPDRSQDGGSSYCLKDGDVSEEEGSEGSPHTTPRRPPHVHHRTRKQEKKKRR